MLPPKRFQRPGPFALEAKAVEQGMYGSADAVATDNIAIHNTNSAINLNTGKGDTFRRALRPGLPGE